MNEREVFEAARDAAYRIGDRVNYTVCCIGLAFAIAYDLINLL